MPLVAVTGHTNIIINIPTQICLGGVGRQSRRPIGGIICAAGVAVACTVTPAEAPLVKPARKSRIKPDTRQIAASFSF